jgi:hypothetical protein
VPREVEVAPMPVQSHNVDAAMSDCQACHNPYSFIAPGPLDHADYDNGGCTECHVPAKEVSRK